MTSTALGCGTPEHKEDCLCDVDMSLSTQTGIHFDPATHWGVNVATSAGYEWDAGPEKLLDLLEALAKAKDAMSNMKTFDTVDRRGVARPSKELREKVIGWIKDGNSIVDAPDEFHESWGNILAALTMGHPAPIWAWSEKDWAVFEDYCDTQEKLSYRAIMREFDLPRGRASKLVDLYGDEKRRSVLWRYNIIKKVIVDHPTQKNAFLVDKIAAAGVDSTPAEVTKVRARLRKLNLVPMCDEPLRDFRKRVTRP